MHRPASVSLDPETLLSAYAQGAFPMTDRDGAVRWFTADPRGVFPLDSRFHVPRTLRQIVRQRKFDIRINHDFEAIMRACMNAPRAPRAPRDQSGGSWISEELIAAYVRLNELGFAHTVECWRDGELAGGLYGVSLGAAFFGESMFHARPNASKVALVHLVDRLRERGYQLLDTQASTPHLEQFGCIEMRAADYLKVLRKALGKRCEFV